VKLLLMVRLKLVAINAFCRLRCRGHILNSLDVSDCGITKEALSFIVPALIDNTNIRSLDLSNNAKLLKSRDSCKQMSRLLKGGCLKDVKLNHLSLDDAGLEELARGIATSPSLRSIELSGNHFGPTAATWLSSLSKQYYLDELEIRNSKCLLLLHIVTILMWCFQVTDNDKPLLAPQFLADIRALKVRRIKT